VALQEEPHFSASLPDIKGRPSASRKRYQDNVRCPTWSQQFILLGVFAAHCLTGLEYRDSFTLRQWFALLLISTSKLQSPTAFLSGLKSRLVMVLDPILREGAACVRLTRETMSPTTTSKVYMLNARQHALRPHTVIYTGIL
jgi:hypothetical protein